MCRVQETSLPIPVSEVQTKMYFSPAAASRQVLMSVHVIKIPTTSTYKYFSLRKVMIIDNQISFLEQVGLYMTHSKSILKTFILTYGKLG